MHRHRRNFRDRPAGLKNENIDRQILVLHKAMAEKLLGSPELVEQVKDKAESRYAQGRLNHGAYLTWLSLLENVHQPQVFLDALLEDSHRMRRLRRNSPFVGVLTEEERQQALLADACGELERVSL